MFIEKTLLITGGTGSFGNAALRTFLSADVKEIRIFSRDEKKQDDMRISYHNEKLKFFIGDVRNYESIHSAMEGVDYVFIPEAGELYPPGYKTYVEVHDLDKKLCGKSRPTHFRGVCTVVLKLSNILGPDIAFFGQKDAQQAIILKKMIKDLNLDIKIVVTPIIRDNDGLALSSRNEYLNEKERKAAQVLYLSLQKVKDKIKKGEKRAAAIIGEIEKIIKMEPLAKIDYVKMVDLEELDPWDEIKGEAMIALAVFVGKTRLIDNMIIQIRENNVII